jgi:hypothetical protein
VAASRAALARLPGDHYPTLNALAEPLAAATHDEGQYAYGLDLLLNGLRAARQQPGAGRRPTGAHTPSGRRPRPAPPAG